MPFEDVERLPFGAVGGIWGVPSMVVPPNHPFALGFSIINHPAIGVPP